MPFTDIILSLILNKYTIGLHKKNHQSNLRMQEVYSIELPLDASLVGGYQTLKVG